MEEDKKAIASIIGDILNDNQDHALVVDEMISHIVEEIHKEFAIVPKSKVRHEFEQAAHLADVISKHSYPQYHELDKYDDTPDFYTLEEIESALNRVHNNYYVDWDVDDLMNKLKEEL